MASTLSSTGKHCATCEYWRGMRDIRSDGKYVNYEGKGQCTSTKSPYKGKEKQGNDSCFAWSKWSALR